MDKRTRFVHIGYSPGDPIGDDADVTLYAVWSQNVTKTWSIIYNANGGYNTPEKQTANVGQSITITSSNQHVMVIHFLDGLHGLRRQSQKLHLRLDTLTSQIIILLFMLYGKKKENLNLHFLSLMIVFLMELEQLKNW